MNLLSPRRFPTGLMPVHLMIATALALPLLAPTTHAQTTKTAPSSPPKPSGHLKLVVSGLRSTEGQVLVTLYNKAEGFPKDESAILECRPISTLTSDKAATIFKNLPHGDYAVAILHDEDGNGDMTYRFGILPKEGYGFSNNIRPKLSAPPFEKVSFTIDSDELTVTVDVVYW